MICDNLAAWGDNWQHRFDGLNANRPPTSSASLGSVSVESSWLSALNSKPSPWYMLVFGSFGIGRFLSKTRCASLKIDGLHGPAVSLMNELKQCPACSLLAVRPGDMSSVPVDSHLCHLAHTFHINNCNIMHDLCG